MAMAKLSSGGKFLQLSAVNLPRTRDSSGQQQDLGADQKDDGLLKITAWDEKGLGRDEGAAPTRHFCAHVRTQ